MNAEFDEKFSDIFEIIGGFNQFEIHPELPLIAFECGCSIILWNLEKDTKIKMHSHKSRILDLKFFYYNYKYIISIDGGNESKLFITDIINLNRIKEYSLPRTTLLNFKSDKCIIKYNNELNLIFILENIEKNGYYLYIFELKNNNLVLVLNKQIENLNIGNGIEFFNNFNYNNEINFIINEDFIIKFYKLKLSKNDNINYNIGLKNSYNINLKENIIKVEICNLTSFLIVLLSNKMIIILNDEGSIINKINNYKINDFCLDNENKLITVNLDGGIHLFNINSVRLMKSVREIGNKIKKIKKEGDIVCFLDEDNTWNVMDFVTLKIMDSIISHKSKIINIIFFENKINEFLTISNDFYCIKWNYLNERWIGKGVSLLSENNKNYIKNETKLNCAIYDDLNKYLILGLNNGNIIKKEINSFNLIKHYNIIKGKSIKNISLSLNKKLLGISYKDGFTIVLINDFNLNNYITIQESSFSNISKKFFQKNLFLNNNKDDNFESNLKTKNLNYNLNYFNNTKKYHDNDNKIISFFNTNILQIHEILIQNNSLIKNIITEFYHEFRCLDYLIHPSNLYLISLQANNLIKVFKIINGANLYNIDLVSPSKKLFIDTSGLFWFTITNINENNSKNIYKNSNIQFNEKENNNYLNKDKNKIEKNSIQMYDLINAEYKGSLKNLFDINNIYFLNENIFINGKKGHFGIFLFKKENAVSIFQTIDNLKENNNYWKETPLKKDETIMIKENSSSFSKQEKISKTSVITETLKSNNLNSNNGETFLRNNQNGFDNSKTYHFSKKFNYNQKKLDLEKFNKNINILESIKHNPIKENKERSLIINKIYTEPEDIDD